MQKAEFSIHIATKRNPDLSGFRFEEIKNAVLGKNYSLSLVFTTPSHMKKLNESFRNKNETTDILSFPLSKTEGEMFLCISVAKKEALKFNRELHNFIEFLFIHGLTHLKGMTHGSRMESEEKKYRKKFNV